MDWKSKFVASALFLAATAAPAVAEDYFTRGTAAFREGDYRTALAHFESEQRRGNKSANLKYNLGVTLFKLGRYRAAAGYFQQLRGDPEWRDLAQLQLALVAERQGRKTEALERYRTVFESDSPKLRKLALARAAQLAPPQTGAHQVAPWLGIASLSAGFDDNAYALQNDLLQDSSVGEDTYTELFAWGQYRLQGTANDGWRLHGFGFGRRYSDLDNLDLSSYNLGVSRDLLWNGWQLELGGAGEMVSLGGEQVTRELRLISRARQQFGDAEVTLAYVPSHFSGSGDYGYLDGWRQRFEGRWERPLDNFTLKALYRLDLNDRADLESGDNGFYSYSPTRQTFGLEFERPLMAGWEVSAGTDYRLSSYDGVNSLVDSDGALKVRERESERLRAWLASSLQLLPQLQLDGRVVLTDNEENFDIYTYDKTEASLSLRYSF